MRIIDLGSSGNVVEYEVPFLDSQNNPIEIFKGQIDVDSGVLVDEYANLASYDPESVPADLATVIEADAEEVSATPGDIVSFDCELGEYPLAALSIPLAPIQDLHGYDSPWPAGGGKNLLNNDIVYPITVNGITYRKNDNGSVSVQGSATSDVSPIAAITINLEAGNYLFNGAINGLNHFDCFVWDLTTNARAKKWDGTTNSLSGYSDLEEIKIVEGHTYTFNMRVNRNESFPNETTIFYPMICLPTETDASYAPYSNICPISGRTGADVFRTGVNVWDEEWEVGGIGSSGGNTANTDRIRTKNYIPVLPSTKYYFNTPKTVYLRWYDAEKNYIGSSPNDAQNAEKTTPSKARYLRFFVDPSYGTTYNNDISINYPSTDHDYHAYNGKVYALTFKDENDNPITVYGGNPTYLGGGNWRLTVTMAIATYNGTETWGGTSMSGFYSQLDGMKKRTDYRGFILCDSAEVYKSNSNMSNMNISGYYDVYTSYPNQNWLYFKNTSCANAYEFRTWLQSNPLQVCYELATPLTYTLTTSELTTLLGQNNVWCDAGEISELKYFDGDVNEFDDIATSKGALLTGSQVVYPRATPLTYQITPVGVDLVEGQNYIFTNTGDTTVRYAEPFSINNPTYHDARPLIRVYGIGVLWVGDYSVTISEADGYTDIDCAMMDCHKGSQNRNRYVTLSNHEYPVLKPGKNIITMGSGITKVEITPRWWRV